MKTIKGLVVLLAVIGGLFFLINTESFQNMFWSVKEFLNPRLFQKLQQEWKDKPKEFLIKEIKKKNYLSPAAASSVLIERKDQNMVSEFIEMLNSKYPRIQGTAVKALGAIGDERAIEPLMDYMKRMKEMNDEGGYLVALYALAEMKYEPVIPEIIKLSEVNKENNMIPQGQAISMLKNYDCDQAIETLIKLTKYPDRLVSKKAEKALAEIKKRNSVDGADAQ